MKYALEGSNGGYPLCDDHFDRMWDYLASHHDCVECGHKNRHESAMYHTNLGWMCIDCYNDILQNTESVNEIPEIL